MGVRPRRQLLGTPRPPLTGCVALALEAQLCHFLAAGPGAEPPASRSLRCHLCTQGDPVLCSLGTQFSAPRTALRPGTANARPAPPDTQRYAPGMGDRSPLSCCLHPVTTSSRAGNGAGSQDHGIPIRAGTGGRRRVSPPGHSVKSDEVRRDDFPCCHSEPPPALRPLPRHGSSRLYT